MKKDMLLFVLLLMAASLFGRASVSTMPRIINQNGRHALLVDGNPRRPGT